MVSTRVLASLAVLCTAGTAVADPTERDDRHRLYQMLPIAGGAAIYLALEFGLKDAITPTECRWCASNAFDTSARTTLVWGRDNIKTAATASNLTGYLGNPLLAAGLLVLTTADEPDRRRWFDDTIPVFQAGIATGLINQTFKVIFGRKRPYANFGGVSTRAANDVNTSFFSGHTALAFAMVTSSGTVAHLRGYRSEAALWIGGGALAVATGYLRIAADAHYTTDVLTGALVGAGVGVAIPLLFHRDVLTDEASAAPRLAIDSKPFMISYGGAF